LPIRIASWSLSVTFKRAGSIEEAEERRRLLMGIMDNSSELCHGRGTR
jgi:hypothetical protein